MDEKLEEHIDYLIDNLSLDKKIWLSSGKDFWRTNTFTELGIPAMMMSDGPHGLRIQNEEYDNLGINDSAVATCFPTAALSACSFDDQLLERMGRALGAEAKDNGIRIVLGPGANIKRNPLCGRNFEYFSEDPLLSGKMAAAHIRGVESTGTAATLKHFALNNQEYKRYSGNSMADDRTLRELYLRTFEIAVCEGHPQCVMSSYNKVNGVHASDNKWLLTDVLRNEWGFDGTVMCDWGGMYDRRKSYPAGCDLAMPGGANYMERECIQAVHESTLSEEDINTSLRRILRLVYTDESKRRTAAENQPLMQANYELACEVARESVVLLKNDDALLPLAPEAPEGVLFVGDMARNPRYQGVGSSHINPWKLTSAFDACPGVAYVQGCNEFGNATAAQLEEVRAAAAQARAVVVFAGLTQNFESEGLDRTHMRMPQGHLDMIEAAAAVNPQVAVVLMCGSAVETPWAPRVKSILYAGLSGEAGGQAIADILFGRANPSGKLAETWPLRYEDCPNTECFSAPVRSPEYREGVYVGYRYFQKAGVPVRFPFGHGLSYTTFAYDALQVQPDGEGYRVTARITNTGAVAGAEAVQLYVAYQGQGVDPAPAGAPAPAPVYRPARELQAFAKVRLQPGESTTVEFTLDRQAFAVWQDVWVVPGGAYALEVGASCEDIRLRESVTLEGAPMPAPPAVWYGAPSGKPTQQDFRALYGREIPVEIFRRGTYTHNETVLEMMQTSWVMRIVYRIVHRYTKKGFPGNVDESNPEFAMMLSASVDCSLSCMKMFCSFDTTVIDGLLDIANGHYLTGWRKVIFRK
ncbi:MAG: glycoside hydrolase family 3 C-terminal domain-containing protein [Coriobacteriia bacterium]|nr:glycoside hydrolase family 3 C-terminal domain-containing protein [Coriobacteriia bacterium]